MNLTEFFKPTRKKILTLFVFRILMVLPYVGISLSDIGSNPNSLSFILSGMLIFFLVTLFNPNELIFNYVIGCFLVEKVKKDSFRYLIIAVLSLSWFVIQVFLLGLFVLPIL